jgi:pimeloyl-ACP methyl ester carboxylesterase
MVLHGRLDSLIPFAAGQKLASLIPYSEFVEVEQGGHDFVFSRDAFLEQRISEFLDSL